MKAKYIFFCVLNFGLHQAFSQGCIAIRNLTGFGQFMIPEYGEEPVKWMVNVNTRYFRSYEEFSGSTNLQIVPEDQKVNHVYVTDISVTKMLDKDGHLQLTYRLLLPTGHPGRNMKMIRRTRSNGLPEVLD
jgi:hypothetical protein